MSRKGAYCFGDSPFLWRGALVVLAAALKSWDWDLIVESGRWIEGGKLMVGVHCKVPMATFTPGAQETVEGWLGATPHGREQIGEVADACIYKVQAEFQEDGGRVSRGIRRGKRICIQEIGW